MKNLELQKCILGPVYTNCYFLKNKETGELIIIDPADCPEKIELKVSQMNGKPVAILLTHGHYYYVSLDLQTLRQEGIARGMDIVMFGHTHRPVIQVEDEITLINPGSISYPRQQDGKNTYIILEISDSGEFTFELKSV